MSKKQWIRKGIVFACAMVIGGLVGAGFVVLKDVLPEAYFTNTFLQNILLAVLVYFFSVAIHEAAHFISFIKNGIQMRALLIGWIMFYNTGEKWTIRLNVNSTTIMGGIAIPNLRPIVDQKNFKEVQQAYAKAIIAAPITSIILGILTLGLGIIGLIQAPRIYQSSIFTITIAAAFTAILVTLSSLLKNDQVVGDFPAYQLSKEDDFFVAMQLYQYTLFSIDFESVRKKNIYLKGLLLEGLEKRFENRQRDLFTVSMIDCFLVEYLVGETERLPSVVSQYCDYFLGNMHKVLGPGAMEQHKIFYFHLIYLLDQRDHQAAIDLYQKNNTISLTKDVLEYYTKQAEHKLGLADNSQFLLERKNIKIVSYYSLFHLFEGYYFDENKLNKI